MSWHEWHITQQRQLPWQVCRHRRWQSSCHQKQCPCHWLSLTWTPQLPGWGSHQMSPSRQSSCLCQSWWTGTRQGGSTRTGRGCWHAPSAPGGPSCNPRESCMNSQVIHTTCTVQPQSVYVRVQHDSYLIFKILWRKLCSWLSCL